MDGGKDTQAQLGDDGARVGFQETINTHFDSTVSYWDGVYGDDDVQGLIYRMRQSVVLSYVDAAALPANARVLEIGCGAGHLTIQLANRQFRVEAVDASQAMVEVTADRMREGGSEQAVTVAMADAHSLPFQAGHFDLVVAVGVIPWLHSPGDAIAEMARVLVPGGQLILTADNGARLSSFTDPREMLARTPLRHLYHRLRKRRGLAMSRLDFPRRIDRLIRRGGLRPVARSTVGYGPLTFWGRVLFSNALRVRINDRLHSLASRGVPGLKWTGWHYVVRATKP
jgi:SAM-dependent methyltransferase